jgi:hypothetical protein
MVRLFIRDSIMYSLSSFGSMSQTEQFMVKSIIPEKLFAVYMKQAS